MASIEPITLGNGQRRYRVRYRDPTGTSRERRFRRKVDTERHARTVEVDMDRGDYIDTRALRMRLPEWIEMHEKTKVHRRPSTIARDESYIRTQIIPALGSKSLNEITALEVRLWIASMVGSGLSPATVRKAHQLLSGSLESSRRCRTDRTQPGGQGRLAEDRAEGEAVLGPCRGRSSRGGIADPVQGLRDSGGIHRVSLRGTSSAPARQRQHVAPNDQHRSHGLRGTRSDPRWSAQNQGGGPRYLDTDAAGRRFGASPRCAPDRARRSRLHRPSWRLHPFLQLQASSLEPGREGLSRPAVSVPRSEALTCGHAHRHRAAPAGDRTTAGTRERSNGPRRLRAPIRRP